MDLDSVTIEVSEYLKSGGSHEEWPWKIMDK